MNKVLVAKCAISLKEAMFLIKQAKIDKNCLSVFVPSTAQYISIAVLFWRGIFVNVKHFIFISCTPVFGWEGI